MERYHIIDGVRGLAAASMVLYHFVWDLVYMAGVRLDWFAGLAGRLWQMSICVTFILVSGFCQNLGRRRLRRGLTVFLCGGAVTAATLIFMPENRIVFGVLTLLGSCMILATVLDDFLRRVPAVAGFVIGVLLFSLTYGVENNTAVFGLVKLPTWLYRNYFTAFFGFKPAGFYSTDYYPLLPWAFLFAAGYYLYGIFEGLGLLNLLKRRFLPPLECIGRRALWIYMLHQPVLAGLVLALSK